MRTNNSSDNENLSHNGDLLRRYIKESGIGNVKMANRMGVNPQTLYHYLGRATLQTRVLWEASLILKRNILFDLGMKLPNDFVSEYEPELQKQIEELKQENERLKIEIGVYEKILKR